MNSRSRWGGVLVFAGIACVALFLRLKGITSQSIWLDEAVSLSQSDGTLGELLSMTAADNYPPLHNLILFASINLLGNNEFAARLPSALLGTLDVAGVYLLATAIAGRRAGALAAAFIALSPFHAWYSQEARMYALMSCSATWLAFLSYKFIERPTWPTAIGATIVATALLYAHPFGILNWGAIGGGILIGALALRRWRTAVGYAAIGVASAAGFGPWIQITASRASAVQGGSFWIQPPTTESVISTITELFGGQIGLFVACAGVLLLLAPSSEARKAEPVLPLGFGLWVVAFWALAPVIAALIISLTLQPLFLSRYLICTAAAISVLAGIGLSRLTSSLVRFAIVASLLILASSAAMATYRYDKDDWRGASAYLAQTMADTDCLMVSPSYASYPLDYYLKRPACTMLRWPGIQGVEPVGANVAYSLSFQGVQRDGEVDKGLTAQGFVRGETQQLMNIEIVKYTRLEPVVDVPVAEAPVTQIPDAAAPVAEQRVVEVPVAGAPAAEVSSAPSVPGQPLVVRIELSGQTFAEPVQYELRADGQTLKSGRAPRKPEIIEVQLDAGLDPSSLEVVLLNDRYEGDLRDINLRVGHIWVGDRAIDLTGVDLGPYLYRTDDGSIIIATSFAPLTINRPSGEWGGSGK